ncbi:MAG TPA: winged helix-turn-helix domain-containing protein [Aridibacter sp.]|nr:winged helix-turn-helix domain-containing protein [Aridibacter sp.]
MSENNVQYYDFGDFRLDLVNYRLTESGEPVPLTQKSFELLQYLIENRSQVLKKDELLDALWEGNYVEEANLTQHVYMLRKALRQKGAEHVFIETIPKTGYRFVAHVEAIVDTGEPEQISAEPHSPHDSDPGPPAISEEAGDAAFPTPPDAPRGIGRANVRTALALIGGCGVLVAAIVYFSGAGAAVIESGPGSIAVLPFKQISEEKDEKLGLGIADVIIAKLANIDSIAVRPTTSIIRYASGDTNDLFEVGKALNVDYVIEGSIQKENGKVRITTQLYSVSGKKQVWTETFDEEYTDIFALQDAISERIAQKVALGFRANERTFPFRQYTSDPEAYQAYSTGLAYWS